LPFGQIGRVTDTQSVIIKAENGREVIKADIASLKKAWQKTFDW
jgi:hypothetical protein